MPAIVTSDIHMTDSPRDEYRWRLFPWLREKAKKHSAKHILILGDGTDAKDKHSSVLVNRMVDELVETAKEAEVVWLKANHDYIDEQWPFFRFLNRPELNIRFVTKPEVILIDGVKALFLPNTKSPKDWDIWDFSKYKLIFCHQTFNGAVSESGRKLGGFASSVFDNAGGDVWSGDIHVPQKISDKIRYVGSPYRVHFGDRFDPRVVLLDKGRFLRDLRFGGVFRHTLDIKNMAELKDLIESEEIQRYDQVKIRVHMKRSEYADWPKLRNTIRLYVEKAELELHGLSVVAVLEEKRNVKLSDSDFGSPQDSLTAFAAEKKLSLELVKVGQKLLRSVERAPA